MQLKTIPEDFIVVEIARHETAPEGRYLLLEMTKRNLTTERALSLLTESLGAQRNNIGYAGTKDARAVTRQNVTIKAFPGIVERIQALRRDNPAVRVLGFVQEPIGLGMLEKNRFEIVVRKITTERAQPLQTIPNYFDEQRFSRMNTRIGELLIKKDFVGAAKAIISTDPLGAEQIREHLEKKPTDGVTALRFIPKNTLLLYAHAYQSALWNEALTKYILAQDPEATHVDGPVPFLVPTHDLENVAIPLVGFGTTLEPPFDAWYNEILAREELTTRDFVVKALPFLSLEGGQRDAFFAVENLEIGELQDDEINPCCKKQRLSFVLPKSCYATLVVKVLYRTGDISGKEN
jgi:tRNA pseudouridine13 synthase